MEPQRHYWCGKKVCVTGGTGFLGWHLVKQLLALGAKVRLLGLAPASPQLRAQLQGLDCVFADIRDADKVGPALRDRDVVFHTAGTVAVWGAALRQMHAIHTEGTRQVLQALPSHARLVHTSSVVAVGATLQGEVLTESSPFSLERLRVDYVHAKKAAEELALAAATRGVDVVVVNPAYLIGPDDYENSVMGRVCLRFWKGKMPLIPPGGFNFVDVRDVARGHLLAAERGACGRRYILGGDNLSLRQFVRNLAKVHGGQESWQLPMPAWLHTCLAWAGELNAVIRRREPCPSLQQVRLSRFDWYYSSARACAELGYHTRPLLRSLEDTHAWYCHTRRLQPAEMPLAPAPIRKSA